MNKITTTENLIQVLKNESNSNTEVEIFKNPNSLDPNIEIEKGIATITIDKEDIPLVEDEGIRNYTFDNIKFVDITFRNVRFSDIHFVSVTFINCTFEDVHFVNCSLKYSSFSETTLKDVYFLNCQGDTILTNPKSFFQDVSVMSSIFWNCKISAVLSGNISLRRSLIPRLRFFPKEASDAKIHLLQTNLPDLEIIPRYKSKNISSNIAVYADEYSHSVHLQCPEEGSFIGFKCARDDTIIKLLITEDALRSSAGSRKCRCSKAKVLSIEYADGTPYRSNSVASNMDPSFIYTVGEIVEVPNFDKDRWQECSTGIHFFITREEAVLYLFS